MSHLSGLLILGGLAVAFVEAWPWGLLVVPAWLLFRRHARRHPQDEA